VHGTQTKNTKRVKMKDLELEKDYLIALYHLYWERNKEGNNLLPSILDYLPIMKKIKKRILKIEKEIYKNTKH
jgi:hypothetical protein